MVHGCRSRAGAAREAQDSLSPGTETDSELYFSEVYLSGLRSERNAWARSSRAAARRFPGVVGDGGDHAELIAGGPDQPLLGVRVRTRRRPGACSGYDLGAGMPSRTGAPVDAAAAGPGGAVAAACQASPAQVRRTASGAASD